MNLRKRAVVQDDDVEPTKVPSSEVARPLTAREIRKNEALADTVKYAKRYHLGLQATVVLGVLATVTIFLSIWSEDNGGRLFGTGFFFVVLCMIMAGLTSWCHDLWKTATKVYLSDGSRNSNLYDRPNFRSY